MVDKLKFSKIFNIFSTLYLPIVVTLFILNSKFGISYGDAQQSEYGEISSLITFATLLLYFILSTIQVVLFFISKMQKSYFGISFLNILLCCILIFLTFGGMLVLAFGFIIAAPILLVIIIMWFRFWTKAICSIKNTNKDVSEQNNNDKSTVRRFLYFIAMIAEIAFIIFATNDFYKREVVYNLRNVSHDMQYKKYKKQEAKKFNNPIYKQIHEQFLIDSENFYNALVQININIKDKTFDQAAEEYKKEFSNIKRYAPILGEYTNIIFDKREVNNGKSYEYVMMIYNKDKLLYDASFHDRSFPDGSIKVYQWTIQTKNESVDYYNYSYYNIHIDKIEKIVNGNFIEP